MLAALLLVGSANSQSTIGVCMHPDGSVAYADSAEISPDGHQVAFNSWEYGLDPAADEQFTAMTLYRYDRRTREIEGVCYRDGTQILKSGFNASMAAGGSLIAFDSYQMLTTLDHGVHRCVYLRDMDAHTTTVLSVGLNGVAPNGDCWYPRITPDARFVAFLSDASNLVIGDTNGLTDVFVLDRTMGSIVRASWSDVGAQAQGAAVRRPDISDDGRFVSFDSDAANLVAGDTNGATDVFVRDLVLGTTIRASVGSNGAQLSGGGWSDLSGNGALVVFVTSDGSAVAGDTNGAEDVLVRDLAAGTTALVSATTSGSSGSAPSQRPRISADGASVAFQSYASNLVAGDLFSAMDIFVRSLATGTTRAASLDTQDRFGTLGQSYAPAISADGTLVAFQSAAPVSGGLTCRLRDLGPVAYYGIGKTNSLGCMARIGAVGSASASAGSGFTIQASNVLNQQPGMLLYSTHGIASTSFGGGTLLIQSPWRRTGVQSSGGSPASINDCSGNYALDFNAWIASGVDPALTVGARVWCQYIGRDPGFAAPADFTLTDGLSITIQP